MPYGSLMSRPPQPAADGDGFKTAAWRTFMRRSTLRYAVKNKRVTVQGPVKKPPMDYMSHRGRGLCKRGGFRRGGEGGSTTVFACTDEVHLRL